MPSGYTALVYDYVSYPEKNLPKPTAADFIGTCARAFGAYVLDRDTPLTEDVPDSREPSSYHRDRYQEATKRIGELIEMSEGEATTYACAEYKDALQYRAQILEDRNKLREAYDEMIDKVQNWIPPTPDHDALKEFCLKQLAESREFDAGDSPYYQTPIELLSGKDWLEKEIAKEKHNIEYHAEEQRKENERTRTRNKWISDLKQSLKGVK